MTPDEIHEVEQRMDALAREYAETHDPRIIAKLKELSCQLRELEKQMQPGVSRTWHMR